MLQANAGTADAQQICQFWTIKCRIDNNNHKIMYLEILLSDSQTMDGESHVTSLLNG
jgi:hypothetical protein